MRPHEPSKHRDTTVVKIDKTRSPRGREGQRYLASGVRVSMRLWEDEPLGETPVTERDYEVVGYVVAGRAELHIEDQVVRLAPGDSYVVPRGARHHYRITERLTTVEATSPPAEVHGRDGGARARRKGETDARSRVLAYVEVHASLPQHVTPASATRVLDEIEIRVDLPRGMTAADAFSAVMCSLFDRLSGGEAQHVVLSLPELVRPLVERCLAHRGEAAGVFDREQFMERIASHLGTDLAAAEAIALAVFAGVKRLLPEKEVQDVTSQLPADLAALWNAH